VDIYETASQMNGHYFVHPYRNCSQYHESRSTRDEAEHDEFGNVRTSCQDRARDYGQDRTDENAPFPAPFI